ncbi:hypothetical protein [uncultured Propionivibrio sp.]|uniref:hypothetical protein n=1 Tax=uncultured Propionivibrio sp. TaxID=426737 RepID=UPI0029C01B87|nr:hypothetical protein [uncultured Propionivibrio sp.]
MNDNFPTLGELVKFAFDVAGVLPRKRGESDGLNDADKKIIQKRLERLVDEEGSLTDRCGELISSLAFLTAGAIPNVKVNLAFGESVMDLFEIYNAVIRDEGTYLNKKDSILWFCRAHAIPRLALSIQKHSLRFNLAYEGFAIPPDPNWYLPTISGDDIVWPIRKVMSWVYETCGVSRTHFHYPGKSADSDHAELQQNLDNASAWFNGKRLPSWPSLSWNFARSFEHLENHSDAAYQRQFPEKLRESIFQVLFLSRLSTSICNLIKEAYGTVVLERLIVQFTQHRDWLSAELDSFVAETTAYIQGYSIPPIAIDTVWMEFSERYWRWFSDHYADFAKKLGYLLEQNDYSPLPTNTVAELIQTYGEYSVRTTLEKLEINREFPIPPDFPRRLDEGFVLKKKNNCSDEDIDQYLREIQQDGLASHLNWMERWLRAVVRYRNGDYESAFYHMEYALEQAKYRAGGSQYLLVNQFIELAAKTDRWKSFKKGVEWALYLGISIRWLRDREPDEEALQFVFAMMQKANYAQL